MCCVCVVIGWMEVGWEGSPPHIIAHTMHGAHAQVELFFVFVFFSFFFSCVGRHGICVDEALACQVR